MEKTPTSWPSMMMQEGSSQPVLRHNAPSAIQGVSLRQAPWIVGLGGLTTPVVVSEDTPTGVELHLHHIPPSLAGITSIFNGIGLQTLGSLSMLTIGVILSSSLVIRQPRLLDKEG
tara:strand:- start:2221 stop:2568 length:348 start_codon:yes stop_codon:yes gene_type:complete